MDPLTRDYLNYVRIRREMKKSLEEVNLKLEALKQIKENNLKSIEDLTQEATDLTKSSVVKLSHYLDYMDLINDAIDVEEGREITQETVEQQLTGLMKNIAKVEGKMQAMKPYFKKGKVLKFEKPRSQTQASA